MTGSTTAATERDSGLGDGDDVGHRVHLEAHGETHEVVVSGPSSGGRGGCRVHAEGVAHVDRERPAAETHGGREHIERVGPIETGGRRDVGVGEGDVARTGTRATSGTPRRRGGQGRGRGRREMREGVVVARHDGPRDGGRTGAEGARGGGDRGHVRRGVIGGLERVRAKHRDDGVGTDDDRYGTNADG